MRKLLTEHVGLTPVQSFLESESWAFYRGASKKDNLNCCINADYGKKLSEGGGGFLKEDVLSADILMSLAFIEPGFISRLLGTLWADGVARDYYDVAGIQSNFYLPEFLTLEMLADGNEKNDFLRLVQPDGWIVGENLLVMIEAKGMRDGAAFNFAQLAKEFLIAKVECKARGIDQPRIILLLTDEQKEKTKGICSLFEESWKQLTSKEKVPGKWSDGKVDFFKNNEALLKEYRPHNDDEITACFRILTYGELKGFADIYARDAQDASNKNLALMISNTISWHTRETHAEAKTPIWSTMLKDLAHEQTPLYELYTGGTINETVSRAEDQFFKEAQIPPDHRVRRAVESVRSKATAARDTIENIHRLYRTQQYWALQKKFAGEKPSDTVTFNFEYFKAKYSLEEKKIDARQCREELKEEFRKLNEHFAEFRKRNPEAGYGENTGIVTAGVPNVRRLLNFHFRSWLDWETDIPGSKFFELDKKIFFVKK